MVSGVQWALTAGDLMLVGGLVCLFFEVLKSTNTGRSSVVEHMLSTLVFVIFLVEFLLVGAAASSVFFILMIMAIFDVVAGFTVSITGAARRLGRLRRFRRSLSSDSRPACAARRAWRHPHRR